MSGYLYPTITRPTSLGAGIRHDKACGALTGSTPAIRLENGGSCGGPGSMAALRSIAAERALPICCARVKLICISNKGRCRRTGRRLDSVYPGPITDQARDDVSRKRFNLALSVGGSDRTASLYLLKPLTTAVRADVLGGTADDSPSAGRQPEQFTCPVSNPDIAWVARHNVVTTPPPFSCRVNR